MSVIRKYRGGVSYLTMFLLIIITILSVVIVMLHLQGKSINSKSSDTNLIESTSTVISDTLIETTPQEKTQSTKIASEKENINNNASEFSICNTQKSTDPIKGCVTIKTLSGSGSGFIYEMSNILYVVTCSHVVNNEPMLSIHDLEGHSLKSLEVLTAKDRDLAFIKLKEPDFKLYPLKVHENVSTLTSLPEVVCYGDSEGVDVIVKCEGKLIGIGPKSVETDTPFVGGNSGGPILLKENNLVIAVAASASRLSEGDKWAKGTRFENETRRFSIRLDNIKIEDMEKTNWGKIDEKDVTSLNQLAEEARENNDILKEFTILSYTASLGDEWSLNRICDLYWDMLQEKKSDEDSDILNKIAFQVFMAVADKQSSSGILNLGLCYLYGIGTVKDTEKGFSKIHEAAEMGNIKAQGIEGYCWFTGIGTTQDVVKATTCYKKAAQGGDEYSLNALGDCYRYGWGVQADNSIAKEYYQIAAELDYTKAQWNMGLCYEEGIASEIDQEKSIFWFKKAAEKGHAGSQVKVGDYYGNTKKDFKNAAYWYAKASLQNESEGMYSLALMYRFGVGGLTRDRQKEYNLMKAAADNEFAPAITEMGLYYRNGDIVTKNPREAMLWFVKGYLKDDARSTNFLGVMCETGECGTPNYNEAFKCYKKAAELGNSFAWGNLGNAYLSGHGTEINYNQAIYWLEKAAKAEVAFAQRIYADCYYSGKGVNKDFNQALYWYSKAAKGEDALGMLSVGVMNEFGQGCEKNFTQAAYWYNMAYQKKNVTAAYRLGLLYYYGNGVQKNMNQAKKCFQFAWEEGQNQEAYKMMLKCY